MANNIYIGNRYVPVFANPVEWDNLREYEPLTIVTYNGTAYTSRQTVPVGTALNNTDYWVVTGNYNAQVELLHQRVVENEKHLTDICNAIHYGVIPKDETKANDNTRIINNLLADGKIVYLPKNEYFINDVLVVKSGSGIIGDGKETMITQISSANGIDVPLIYDPNLSHIVYSYVVLKDFRIYGRTNNGIGINIYNYTYNITCHSNGDEYNRYKGNSYGLELRNSDISNIQITCFDTGLKCDVGVGVGVLDNFFIDTANSVGFIDNSADMSFANFNVTFCKNHGISCNTTIANKYINFKVYMNGKSGNGSGCVFYNCRNMMISNLNTEENCSIGAQFIKCSASTIDIISASNGFGNTSSDDYSKAGVAFTDCSEINGTVVSVDKNALYFGQEATQTYGITTNNGKCGVIQYSEGGNLYNYNSLDDNAKEMTRIKSDLVTGVCKAADGVFIKSDFTNKLSYCDNEISFNAHIAVGDNNIPANNWLLIMDDINETLNTETKRTFSIKNHVTDFLAVGNNGYSYPCRYTIGQSVQCLVEIPHNIELSISLTVPYSFR